MKSKMKKIVALLCATVMVATSFFGHWYTKQVEAATTEAEPIFPDGYEYLTLKDFEGLTPGTLDAKGGYKLYQAKNYTNSYFDNVLLSMKLKFAGGGSLTRLDVAGTGWWSGIEIYPSEAGDKLTFYSSIEESNGSYGLTDVYKKYEITSSEAEVGKFVDEEILLQLAFNLGVVDNETGKADLTLGVYINGNFVKDLEFPECNLDEFGKYLNIYSAGSGGSAITYDNVLPPVEPIFPDGYEYLTLKDFEGLTPGTLDAKGGYKLYQAKNYTNSYFDNVLLSMKLKFAGGGSLTRLDVAGTGWWSGIEIYPSEAGDKLTFYSSIEESNGSYGLTDVYKKYEITSSEAEVGKFVDEEILLQLAFNLGVVDNETGKADLTLGVYINGNFVKDLEFPECNLDEFGKYLNIYSAGSGGSAITYDNVLPPVEAVVLDGFDNVTISDFTDTSGNKMTAKEYAAGNIYGYSVSGLTNLNKKLVSMNVTFKADGYNHSIIVGGNALWVGFNIHPANSGSQLVVDKTWATTITSSTPPTLEAQTAGVGSFIDNEFLLQMSFEYVNEVDGVADLKLGIYINGELYNNEVFTIAGCSLSTSGANMSLLPSAAVGKSIIIGKEVEFPTVPVDPFESYEEVTIKDFVDESGKVMVEKAYTHPSASVSRDLFTLTGGGDFNDKVLSMNVKLKAGGYKTRLEVAGSKSYNGLWIYPNSDTGNQLWIIASPAYTGVETKQDIVINASDIDNFTSFVNTQFLLQLTFDFDEVDAETNKFDLTVGVYINGESCGSTTFTGCDPSCFGRYMGLHREADESTIIVGSIGAQFPADPGIQPSGRYEKVTYTQFGIADGEYTDVSGALKDETSVAGHVLCGDIQLKITGAQYTQIVLGGTDAYRWGGIRLLTNTADYFDVMWYEKDAETDSEKSSYVTQLKASTAGVDFNGEEFNLMMSTEIVEHDGDGNADDIKLGIWFNGVLYDNTYYYIDNKGPSLGNYFLVSSEQAFLNADPELSKLPNKNFDKVTFSDFGLETDIYKQADGMVKSTATDYPILDKTVFSGDFRLSDSGDYQIIYGGNSDWNGFRIIVNANGTATLGWYKYNSETEKDETQISAIINPTDVGLTSFTKETFNLKISTELVDNDYDGNINDIKLAIWLNDVLYPIDGSDYSIITDWGATLQNHFSVCQATQGTNVALRNDVEYQSNPCYYEDISSFRQDTGYTYPTLEGYVFGGWYADAEYTEWIGTDVTTGDAWAKFVEEDVLSAKTQVKVDNTGAVPTDSTDLRLATTVDSLEYRKISFYLQKQQGDGSYGAEKDAATLSNEDGRLVYEKLYYIGSNTETMSYKPSAFSWQSEYFKTFTLTGIPSTDYGVMIKATPFWVTMDGTIVRGKTLETCVNNYEKPGTNLSTAVSFDFLGEDVMPITGFFGPYTVSKASDPLMLPDYNTDTYFEMIADLGVNLIVHSNDNYASLPNATKKQLELGEKYGIGIFVNDSNIMDKSETDMLAQIANYSGYKSFVGMHLVDEPGSSNYCSASENDVVSNYTDETTILNNNNIMFYGNMYPILDVQSAWWEGVLGAQGIDDTDKTAYKKYLDEYYSALNPKVLSYDYYPFSDTRINDDGTYNLDLYCWNLATIREKALATGTPFWAYVQAGSQWNDSKSYFESKTPYYPDKEQFNWSANTALAFGAQGIQYFPLVQPIHFAQAGTAEADKMWDFNRNGLIGAWGNKTEWYDYAQSLNKHIAAIDSVLMKSYSKQIIALGETAQNDTNGLTGVTKTASYNSVLTNATTTGNALVGCFDYCGKTALYVVNYDFDNSGDVTLTFNGAKNITKIENAVTTEESSASSLTLNMEAGEGILLVIE